MSDGEIPVGSRVVDGDDTDPNPAVVVKCPDKRADEWNVDEHTVATFPGNEQYADDAPVVVVVFENDADEYDLQVGDARVDLAVLAERDVPYYAFPAPRLELVDPAPEPPDKLLAIADRLRDGGMTVEVDARDQVIRATKLGEEYVVSTDGVLVGGALTEQIESVVHRA